MYYPPPRVLKLFFLSQESAAAYLPALFDEAPAVLYTRAGPVFMRGVPVLCNRKGFQLDERE